MSASASIMKTTSQLAAVVAVLVVLVPASAQGQLFPVRGSPANPLRNTIFPALN